MAQNKYITVAELAEAFDENLLADLGGDGSSNSPVNESNVVLLNAIERASARVESYCLQGGRYTETDLLALQTDDDWKLKGLVAALAVVFLFRRRGGQAPPDIEKEIEQANKDLDSLREGKTIFRDAGAIDAGKPKVAVIPSSTRNRLGLVGDNPFFPSARDQFAE